MACCGGLRYKPRTSAAFSSKWGSSERTYRSKRCGCSPARRHTRATKTWLIPNTWPTSACSSAYCHLAGAAASSPRCALPSRGGSPHGRRLPAAPGPQPREPGGLEAPLPAVDVVRVTPEGRGDRRKRLPCREHQNDPRAPRVFGAALAPPDPSLQFGAFIRVQHQRHMALQYTTTDSVGTGH